MAQYASTGEMSRALGLPLLFQADVDTGNLGGRQLRSLAAWPFQSGALYRRLQEALRDTLGRTDANGLILWIAGLPGAPEHRPWAIGLADQFGRNGLRTYLLGDVPAQPTAANSEKFAVPAPLLRRAGRVLPNRPCVSTTDIDSVYTVGSDGHGLSPEPGAASSPWCALFTGATSAVDDMSSIADAVVLACGYQQHSMHEIESALAALSATGVPLLGLIGVGPGKRDDYAIAAPARAGTSGTRAISAANGRATYPAETHETDWTPDAEAKEASTTTLAPVAQRRIDAPAMLDVAEVVEAAAARAAEAAAADALERALGGITEAAVARAVEAARSAATEVARTTSEELTRRTEDRLVEHATTKAAPAEAPRLDEMLRSMEASTQEVVRKAAEEAATLAAKRAADAVVQDLAARMAAEREQAPTTHPRRSNEMTRGLVLEFVENEVLREGPGAEDVGPRLSTSGSVAIEGSVPSRPPAVSVPRDKNTEGSPQGNVTLVDAWMTRSTRRRRGRKRLLLVLVLLCALTLVTVFAAWRTKRLWFAPDASAMQSSSRVNGFLAEGEGTLHAGRAVPGRVAADEAVPSVSPEAPVEASTPVPLPGSHVIQVASFQREVQARIEAARLAGLGLTARVVPVMLPELGPWFRLIVGSFETRDEAEQAASELVRSGLVAEALVVASAPVAPLRREQP